MFQGGGWAGDGQARGLSSQRSWSQSRGAIVKTEAFNLQDGHPGGSEQGDTPSALGSEGTPWPVGNTAEGP